MGKGYVGGKFLCVFPVWRDKKVTLVKGSLSRVGGKVSGDGTVGNDSDERSYSCMLLAEGAAKLMLATVEA